MSQPRSTVLLQHIRKLVPQTDALRETDRELLRRFAEQHDEDAFTTLVRRHGPMVRSLCLRMLHNWHEAEDACQATFLVLASRAASEHWQASVASWLYQVAIHVARKTNAATRCRRAHESKMMPRTVPDPLETITGRELLTVLDEELARLPEKYRTPLLLCYLEGATRDEAVCQLGCPLGTLKSRLERGRELLRLRLARRGLAVSTVLSAALYGDNSVRAALPVVWERVAEGAMLGTGLRTATVGAISARALTLAKTVLQSAALAKFKVLAFVLLAVSMVVGGVGAAAYGVLAETPRAATEEKQGPNPLARQGSQAPADTGKPATDAYGDPLPEGALGRLGTVRLRHANWVNAVVFAPDGKTLVSASWDNTIRFWDLTTGKELRRLLGHTNAVHGLAFTPDGKTLASSGGEGMVRIWDLGTGKEVRAFEAHQGSTVHCLAIAPNGKTLATGGGGNGHRTLVLWDLATGKELFRLAGNTHRILSVAFSPDGKILASGSSDLGNFGLPPGANRSPEPGGNAVHLWDVRTGKVLRTLEGHGAGVSGVTFASNGKRLASASHDGTIRLWDVNTGKEMLKVKVPSGSASPAGPAPNPSHSNQGGFYSVAFSPDGKTLATAGQDGVVRVWSATGKEMKTFAGHSREVHSVAFSGDGKTLASGSWDNTIRLWDFATGKQVHTWPGHDGVVNVLACSPDGKLVASAGHDRTVRLWERATGRELHVLRGHTDLLFALTFSADSKLVVSASWDETVRVWDVARGKEMRKLPQAGRAEACRFSPDGTLLATVSGGAKGMDGTVQLWNLNTNNPPRTIEAGPQVSGPLLFSPDGKLLAVGGHGQVQLVEVANGKNIRSYAGPWEFAFAPNGKTLVTTNGEGLTQLWDISRGRQIYAFGAQEQIRPFVLSPDGRILVRASRKNEVTLWEVATGKERKRLAGHENEVTCAAFSPDGRSLFTGSEDTSILLWDGAGSNRSPAGELSAKEAQTLWDDLASDDAGLAGRAISRLTARPGEALEVVRRNAKAAAPADPKLKLTDLLARLDHDDFAERESAMRKLEDLAEVAEPSLRDAMAKKPSPEVKRRIEELLRKFDAPLVGGSQVRGIRVIEILERIGTREAGKILDTLSRGAPGARLTEEAKAALARLALQATLITTKKH